jgi:hypothetical protein
VYLSCFHHSNSDASYLYWCSATSLLGSLSAFAMAPTSVAFILSLPRHRSAIVGISSPQRKVRYGLHHTPKKEDDG